jgi:hypothetical protein
MFGELQITVCRVTEGSMMTTLFSSVVGKLAVKKTFETSCLPDQYASFFTMLVSQYGVKTVRILLSEEDTYLKLLTFPKNTIVTRNFVMKQVKEIIPEEIDDACMDWKYVSLGTHDIGVQVYVIKKSILLPILDAAAQAGVTIASCESPSFAICHALPQRMPPSLFIYPKEQPAYIAAIQDGRVLEVVSVDATGSVEEAKQTLTVYLSKMWNIEVKKTNADVPDPVLGLAMKTELSGKDEQVLNIPRLQSDRKDEQRPSRFVLILILFFAIELIGLAVWLWKK